MTLVNQVIRPCLIVLQVHVAAGGFAQGYNRLVVPASVEGDNSLSATCVTFVRTDMARLTLVRRFTLGADWLHLIRDVILQFRQVLKDSKGDRCPRSIVRGVEIGIQPTLRFGSRLLEGFDSRYQELVGDSL